MLNNIKNTISIVFLSFINMLPVFLKKFRQNDQDKKTIWTHRRMLWASMTSCPVSLSEMRFHSKDKPSRLEKMFPARTEGSNIISCFLGEFSHSPSHAPRPHYLWSHTIDKLLWNTVVYNQTGPHLAQYQTPVCVT